MRKGDSEEFLSSLPSTTTLPWTKVTGGRDEATLSLVFYFLSAKKGVCPRVSVQGHLPKGVYSFSVFLQCFEGTRLLVKNTWAEYW
jgi:hypothetical protein